MAPKKFRLTQQDTQVAVTLTAALAAPARVANADELVSTLQEVMTALVERGGVAGISRAALEIAAMRAKHK